MWGAPRHISCPLRNAFGDGIVSVQQPSSAYTRPPVSTLPYKLNHTMTIAIRALAVAAVLAGTLSTPALAQRSNTAGVNLGLFLNGTAAEVEDGDEIDSGGGITLHLGYGFSQSFQLFARATASNIESEGFEDDQYALAHFDVGGRFSFGNTGSALRPFVQGAFSGRAASFDLGADGTLDVRGSGLSAGGGLEYFVTEALAIEAGLAWTFGEFTEGRVDDGDWEGLEDFSFEMNTTRFDLGVSWHP